MGCQEKESLMEKYEKAVRAYTVAVRNMRDDGASLTLAEFEVIYNFAVQANERCQAAQESLSVHLGEHGC